MLESRRWPSKPRHSAPAAAHRRPAPGGTGINSVKCGFLAQASAQPTLSAKVMGGLLPSGADAVDGHNAQGAVIHEALWGARTAPEALDIETRDSGRPLMLVHRF
jgi:hypothetical protein